MLKRIMFLLPSLGGGGAERTVVQLANNFAERGLNIDLAVCDIKDEKGKLLPEVNAKVKLINLDCGRVANAIFPLKKIFQFKNYDFVVSTQTHTNIICAIAKKLSGAKTKLIFREVSTPSKNIKNQGLARFILKKLVNLTYKSADRVVCVSNGVLEDFREFYAYAAQNLVTVYNPVIDDLYLEKLKLPINHPFFSNHTKVILSVGRLTEAKNFSFLIKSFNQLYQKYPETRLIILGEGELRSELEQLVTELRLRDVVDLPGFDLNPYAYFKYVDLFVLSSNWEGLPGVLIQALASKVRIVSTNCPSGPMEILANSKFGLLVKCGDVDGMSTAMQSAIFENYVVYNIDEFDQHCQQFHKSQVLVSYLKLMGIQSE